MKDFITNEKILVKKIEVLPEGRLFYPDEKNQNPVFISKGKYSGALPSIRRFTGKKHLLEYRRINDFIFEAALNGETLFSIREEDFPPELKVFIAKKKKLEQLYQKVVKAENNEILTALEKYLQFFPPDLALEDEISQFSACWRLYLKLHFYSGKQDEDHLRRFNLAFQLVKIAAKMYKRHVSENEYCAKSLAMLRFNSPYPGYRTDVALIESCCKPEDTQITLANYYEADRLISQLLPKTDTPLLKRYLNYAVQLYVCTFAEDNATLEVNRRKDFWGEYCSSEESEIKRQFAMMKLPQTTNFILPQTFSKEAAEKFLLRYSLE